MVLRHDRSLFFACFGCGQNVSAFGSSGIETVCNARADQSPKSPEIKRLLPISSGPDDAFQKTHGTVGKMIGHFLPAYDIKDLKQEQCVIKQPATR
jgi:hypothetical protein